MKMYKIADYQAFSDLIEHCNGPVYVVSKDGNWRPFQVLCKFKKLI